MRQRLRWADGKLVKEAIDQQLVTLIGPRGQESPQKKTNNMVTLNTNTCLYMYVCIYVCDFYCNRLYIAVCIIEHTTVHTYTS